MAALSLSKIKKLDLTKGTPWKVILLFAIPFFLTSILSLLFTTVDSLIIGQIIPDQYAGVSDVGSVYSYLTLFASGCSVGFSSVVGNYFGEKDEESVKKAFYKSLFLGFLVAIFVSLSFFFASTPLLNLLGLSAEKDAVTFNAARIYFVTLIIGFVISMLNSVVVALMRSLGKSAVPFYFLTLASLINALFTFLLVWMLPTSDMKVAGAAIATLFSQLCCLILSLTYIFKKFPYLSLKNLKRADFHLHDPITKKLLSNALPLILQHAAVVISTFVISQAFVSFDYIPGQAPSTDAQTAKAVAQKVISLSYAWSGSISASLLYYVAQNNGAHRRDRIKKGIIQAYILDIFFFFLQLGICTALAWTCDYAYIFVDASKITEHTKWCTHVIIMGYSCLLCFQNLNALNTNSLIGAEKPAYAIIATLIELPIRFFFVFGLRYWCFDSIYSNQAFILMAVTEPLSWIASSSFTTYGVIKTFYKRKKMKDDNLLKIDYTKIHDVLDNHGVIAFPTETVMGLGVYFDDEIAYKRLNEIKRRPENKPYSMMIGDPSLIHKYAYINESGQKLIDAFMPGEITLLLKAKEDVPSWVTHGTGIIGIRVPADEDICEMLLKLKKPLLVPSANRAGEMPTCNSIEVKTIFGDEVGYIVDGFAKGGISSTIIDITENEPKIIREGRITFDHVKEVLEEK